MRSLHVWTCMTLLAAAAFPAPAAVPALDTTAPLNHQTYFGINGVGYFHRPTEEEELRRRWELMKELGVKWDRSDFWWNDIEKAPGQWDYSKADDAMRTYREHGVQMLPILDYGAAWRRTEAPVTDEQRAEWARYVQNVISRYKGYANTWEVWNEPNIIPFWRPQPRVEDYAALLKLTGEVAARTSPESRLVAFAMADMHPDFLERTLELNPSYYFHAASYHFYRTELPENRLPDEIQEMRLILRRFGKNVPVWVTEMGVTSHPTEGVSEDLQAVYWMRNILLLIAGGAERVFPFTLVDPTADPGGEWGNKLGMVDLQWRKKPVFYAYKTMIAELNDFEYMGGVHFGDDVKAFAFRGRYGTSSDGHWKLAAYSTAGPRDIRLEFDDNFDTASSHFQVTRMAGEKSPLAFHGRTARVMLDGAPCYIPVKSKWIEHLAWGVRFAGPGEKSGPYTDPAAIMASPGQEIRMSLLCSQKPDAGIPLQLPRGWSGTTTGGVSFLVPPNTKPGWYTVRVQPVFTSGTVVRDLRVWVREPARVEFRPFVTTSTQDVRTQIVIHDTNLIEPREWWVQAKPAVDALMLPSGVVGGTPPGSPPFVEADFSAPRSAFAQLERTTAFQVLIGSGRRNPALPPIAINAFKMAVTPLMDDAPVVDGRLGEYALAPRMTIGEPEQLTHGEFTSPEDAYCTAAAVWTREGVFIAAAIVDDHPKMNDHGAGGDVYKGDAVEVYIGPVGHKGGYYAKKEEGYYHFGLSPGRGGEGALVSNFETEVPGAKIAVTDHARGYMMEAFIPGSAMGGYVPARGDIIAWDLQLNDCDDYSKTARHKAFMWNGDRMNWLRTARWGMAVVK